MILITATVALSPANAASMLDCDGTVTAPAKASEMGHDHASMSHADKTPAPGDMKADHCASHACLMAIAALAIQPAAPLRLAQPQGLPVRASLIDLAIPEGLRRPPRA
ncbi:hypothetical protein V8J36_02675 [Frigidibacter sp. MR17.14]|uniref:hypothetical protein n=1 Tax=Frigidibacter sp. MR17.14 TaxID=3126509 RepID=UPI003012D936